MNKEGTEKGKRALRNAKREAVTVKREMKRKVQKEKRLAVKKKKKDAKEKNNCLDEQTRNEEIAKGGEDGSRLGAERQKDERMETKGTTPKTWTINMILCARLACLLSFASLFKCNC